MVDNELIEKLSELGFIIENNTITQQFTLVHKNLCNCTITTIVAYGLDECTTNYNNLFDQKLCILNNTNNLIKKAVDIIKNKYHVLFYRIMSIIPNSSQFYIKYVPNKKLYIAKYEKIVFFHNGFQCRSQNAIDRIVFYGPTEYVILKNDLIYIKDILYNYHTIRIFGQLGYSLRKCLLSHLKYRYYKCHMRLTPSLFRMRLNELKKAYQTMSVASD